MKAVDPWEIIKDLTEALRLSNKDIVQTSLISSLQKELEMYEQEIESLRERVKELELDLMEKSQ